jgi:hypothetical protein
MYELLCRLERFLHWHIKFTLEQVFGPEQWWYELPPTIRKQCQNKKEDDPERHEDPYSYTTFIDLHDIFKEHWTHLSKNFPGHVRANRKEFLSGLQTLNGLRNRVMHPVREYRPTQADFKSVSTFAQAVFAEAITAG